jgi:hypothetical protein
MLNKYLEGATLEQLAVFAPLELDGAALLEDGSSLLASTENPVDLMTSFESKQFSRGRDLVSLSLLFFLENL